MYLLFIEIIYVFTFNIFTNIRSDHKFDTPTGYATFWNHIVDSVDFVEDRNPLPKVFNAHVDTLYKNKTPIMKCVCSNVKFMLK